MVESGNALCVMGNHEFNAIGYLTPDPNTPGENSATHFEWVEWFKTLMDGGWGPTKALDDDLLVKLHAKNTPMEGARKLITCGLEIPLPAGRCIEGKVGSKHYEVRVANWRYLDWSAAARGPLVAYRWDGESTLSDDKLEWVDKTG